MSGPDKRYFYLPWQRGMKQKALNEGAVMLNIINKDRNGYFYLVQCGDDGKVLESCHIMYRYEWKDGKEFHRDGGCCAHIKTDHGKHIVEGESLDQEDG